MSSVFKLDKAKVKRSFSAASSTYDGAAGLQRSVGLRLLRQVEALSSTATLLDVGCGTGFIASELLKRESFNCLLAMDIALPMLFRAREKLESYPNVLYVCADAERMALQADRFDLIVSNLALQWCRDLSSVFSALFKGLKPEGVVLFSTFGERTLCELKQAWASVDAFRHVNDFYNECELTNFLKDAGFTSISCETIVYRSKYASVIELMKELKGIGARHSSTEGKKHVTTRRELESLLANYPQGNTSEAIVATFEVILVKAKI